MVQYGSSERANVDGLGLPILRMSNLQDDSWDLSEIKHLEASDSDREKYRLRVGDVLFNRTNGTRKLVGKCAVFSESDHWLFASYLIRVRLKEKRILPAFFAAFLNTKAGRIQVERASRQIMMSNVNSEEIRDLLIPLPPDTGEQAKLLKPLRAERARRDGLTRKAHAQLTTVNETLSKSLGIRQPDEWAGDAYAMRIGSLGDRCRLSADYFHPERRWMLKAITEAYPGDRARPLGEIADFCRETVSAEGRLDYFGLASVESHTGELVRSDETADGNAVSFCPEDVLFSRLRPYLNKVYLSERDGICSPEFYVIRVRKKPDGERIVLPGYLAAILRSQIVYKQVIHMMTGNTHPRLAKDDVFDLLVPVPDRDVQVRIADAVERARKEAQGHRAEADGIWDAAKADFERALLGHAVVDLDLPV